MALLASVLWCGTRWYGVIDSVQGVTILYSKDAMFAYISHGRSILTDRRWRLMAKSLASMLQFPEHVSEDLLVVHLEKGMLAKHDLRDFGFGGGPFVYHGEVYWGRGSERVGYGPTIWRWDGSQFIPLSDSEVSLFNAEKIKDVDATTRAEGWYAKAFKVSWSKPEVTVQLLSGNFRIYAVVQPLANGRNERIRIMLKELGSSNAPETLIDVVEGYQKINREEYMLLKGQGAKLARDAR